MLNDYRRELARLSKEGPLRDGTDAVIAYLLEATPFLVEYQRVQETLPFDTHPSGVTHHMGPWTENIRNALRKCNKLHQEFQERFMVQLLKTIEIPVTCGECNTPNSIVRVTEIAAYVCSKCGVEIPYYVPENGGGLNIMDSLDRNPGVYRYNPKSYFRKYLNELQGNHNGHWSRKLLDNLTRDFEQHHIAVDLISPHITLAALKRLRQPRFYACRWALTHHFNSTYTPLKLTDSTVEALLTIFSRLMNKFVEIVNRLNLNRRNLPSYPYFTQQTLRYLGFTEEATRVQTLKSSKRRALQCLLLNEFFKGLGTSFRCTVVPEGTPVHTTNRASRRPISRRRKQRALRTCRKRKMTARMTARKRRSKKRCPAYRFSIKEKKILRFIGKTKAAYLNKHRVVT